ncbi:MAG: ribosome-recycling factor [bacterium]|nr:ribosome-recycling factor [Patescibacteria group bacterium]MDW8279962.1 ribosome-recycling factor [bacterium]
MIDQIIKNFELDLKNILDKFSSEIKSIRSNRPSVELIENIKVNVYNDSLPIKQLGALSLKPPRTIQINIWDKNIVNNIVGAINDSKMGFSVSIDGNNIFVNLPELTSERRAEFIKLAKKIAEDSRIHVRNKRDEIIKKIKNLEQEQKINEDEIFKNKEKIQKIVDEINLKIENLLKEKIDELNS